MIGQSLVFVCAVALAAGSCLTSQQGLSQVLSGPSFVSTPVVSTPTTSIQASFVSSPSLSSGSTYLPASPLCGSSQLLSGSQSFLPSGAVLSQGLSSEASLGVQATNGPVTAPLPVIQAPPVVLPAVESPVVALPSQPIPAPRVLSQRCICTKTIVRPQVYQRTVTVPKIQRYIKRTVTPIVENISYKSSPASQGCASGAVLSDVMTSGPIVSSGCTSPVAFSSRSVSSPVVSLRSVQSSPVAINSQLCQSGVVSSY